MMPRFSAIVAACVRSLAPSLEDVPDAALDRFLGDRELIGNLFVGVPGGNQAQDIDFVFGLGVIGGGGCAGFGLVAIHFEVTTPVAKRWRAGRRVSIVGLSLHLIQYLPVKSIRWSTKGLGRFKLNSSTARRQPSKAP
jgi:hypothetical protein